MYCLLEFVILLSKLFIVERRNKETDRLSPPILISTTVLIELFVYSQMIRHHKRILSHVPSENLKCDVVFGSCALFSRQKSSSSKKQVKTWGFYGRSRLVTKFLSGKWKRKGNVWIQRGNFWQSSHQGCVRRGVYSFCYIQLEFVSLFSSMCTIKVYFSHS